MDVVWCWNNGWHLMDVVWGWNADTVYSVHPVIAKLFFRVKREIYILRVV